jgi:hypothetical protein
MWAGKSTRMVHVPHINGTGNPVLCPVLSKQFSFILVLHKRPDPGYPGLEPVVNLWLALGLSLLTHTHTYIYIYNLSSNLGSDSIH